MEYLSPKEIEKALIRGFDFTSVDIERYYELFDDDYAQPKIVATINYINKNRQIFQTKNHKRNTMLKKFKELHNSSLNVRSSKHVLSNLLNKRTL